MSSPMYRKQPFGPVLFTAHMAGTFANQRDARTFATEMPWNLVRNVGSDDSHGDFGILKIKGWGHQEGYLT